MDIIKDNVTSKIRLYPTTLKGSGVTRSLSKKAYKRLNAACSDFDSGKRKESFNGWFFYRNPEKQPRGYSTQNLKRVLETELRGIGLEMFNTFCGNTI